MNIVMIGQKEIPSRQGGIEVVVEELSLQYVSLGHNVTLLNRKRKDKSKTYNYKGIKNIEVFTINKRSLDAIVYAFFATLKVRKMIKKKQVDIVHFHAEGPCFFLFLLKRLKHKCKIVVTIHGLDWKRGKWGGLASKVILDGEKRAVKYANEIIVLCKNNQTYFKDKYKRNTILIPNGVTFKDKKEPTIIKEKYNLEKDSYILYLARIVEEKGTDLLIKAFKELRDKNISNKKLVIAGGDAHEKEYYKNVVLSCKDDKDIILTNFVEGDVLLELYSNAYLYCLPSYIEGMPMSLLEALSFNIPCLTSDIEENCEVLDGTNYTFKSGDYKDLKRVLEQILISNKLNFTRPSTLLSWAEVALKTLEIYNTL